MKWLCFGAGAIGTYLGGSLALAGEDLTFLEQPAVLGELRTEGAPAGLARRQATTQRRCTHPSADLRALL